MLGVAHKKLQCIGARGEIDKGLSLSGAKVQVVFCIRNGLIKRRDGHIDEQVVVSGVREGHTGRCHPDVARPEPYFDAARAQGLAVVWPADIYIGILRRWRTLAGRRRRRLCDMVMLLCARQSS